MRSSETQNLNLWCLCWCRGCDTPLLIPRDEHRWQSVFEVLRALLWILWPARCVWAGPPVSTREGSFCLSFVDQENSTDPYNNLHCAHHHPSTILCSFKHKGWEKARLSGGGRVCGESFVCVEVSERSVEVQEVWVGTGGSFWGSRAALSIYESTGAEHLNEDAAQGYLFRIKGWLVFCLRSDNWQWKAKERVSPTNFQRIPTFDDNTAAGWFSAKIRRLICFLKNIFSMWMTRKKY